MKFSAPLTLALLSASTGSAIPPPRATCATGVHMIIARASTEPQGEGVIGQIATQIKAAILGSDSEAVVYPASLLSYASSQVQGVEVMTQLVESYVLSCPETKIVLLGYSQGAHVVGDTMCGSGTEPELGGLSEVIRKNVIATIQMGDPAHVINQPQDVGTSTLNGGIHRLNAAACADVLGEIGQSYCDSGDESCARGNSPDVHVSYVEKYGSAAVSFITKAASAAGVATQ